MKLTKTAGKGNKLDFELQGQDWYANTIRRLILNEVPTMAVELVEIAANDSILYDEMVAHRLGLIPLTTDLKGYNLPTAEEMESGEFLAQSSCQLSLEAKGPCIVYAKDLKSKDPKVKPVYPDMPIAKLLEGQELKVIVTAVLGQGKDHTKWSPGHAHFKKVEDGKYAFSLESWGQLKPNDIMESAIEQYNKQLKEFESLL
ncbi:MAG: DNA-directed RNA polymerase subunit D [Candidatus Woesearchaeota archaeon]|nr:DNA-directed RNA polymerase subunit D [Candidatus Woesearchaeota archaeon]